MIETIAFFGVVILYLATMLVYRNSVAKFSFDTALGISVIAVTARTIAYFLLNPEDVWISMIPVLAGAGLFILLVFAIGNKMSGETTLVLATTFALSPGVAGLITYAIALVALVLVLVKKVMTITGMDVKSVGLDVAHQTGLLEGKVSLKNMEAPTDGKRMTIIPVLLVVYGLSLIVTLLTQL